MSQVPYEKEAFKFCPVCGGEFRTNSEIEKECKKCGYIYFIASKPSAGAIITNKNNEILLIRRSRNPYKGSLDIPAGFCDATETLEQALIREMNEEVGIKVKNYEYYRSVVGDYEFKGVMKRYMCAIFIVRTEDTAIPGDDAESLRWYKFSEIDFGQIKFVTSATIIREVIDKLSR
jgi:mutator protein MutT